MTEHFVTSMLDYLQRAGGHRGAIDHCRQLTPDELRTHLEWASQRRAVTAAVEDGKRVDVKHYAETMEILVGAVSAFQLARGETPMIVPTTRDAILAVRVMLPNFKM